MKKIIPYKTTTNALATLDNGGRFYNLATKANDGNISSAELSKVAGFFSDKQKMILYLEMSLIELDKESRKKVLTKLSQNLKSAHSKYLPQIMTPSEAVRRAKVSSSAIVTGIPKLVDSKSEFTGFIMIPISTGKTTTFTMIPIFDQYDVYELRDNETSEEFLVAHNRSSRKLDQILIRCAGVIKELRQSKKEKKASNIFLEMLYYTPL